MTLYLRLQEIGNRHSYESMCRKIRKMKAAGHTRKLDDAKAKLRVGYLDIEATHLSANFGFILSWYIKYDSLDQYDCSVITKREIFSEKFDYRVVKELLEAFQNFDVLWTHYGADRRFDLPYIRTRAYAHGLEHMLPSYQDKFIADTWPIARNKLKLHSNRLGSIAEALQITDVSKTPLSGPLWVKAAVGNAEALAYIADHNKADVDLLEAVKHKLDAVNQPVTLRSM
jgi:uncharacterized protein YprB with RNaseH-like and TPR domain